MVPASAEVIVTVEPEDTSPDTGEKVGVDSWAVSLVTVIEYETGIFPVSVATMVITSGVPGVNRIGSDALPDDTSVPFTVIVPVPVGVTVIEDTALRTVRPVYVCVPGTNVNGEPALRTMSLKLAVVDWVYTAVPTSLFSKSTFTAIAFRVVGNEEIVTGPTYRLLPVVGVDPSVV